MTYCYFLELLVLIPKLKLLSMQQEMLYFHGIAYVVGAVLFFREVFF